MNAPHAVPGNRWDLLEGMRPDPASVSVVVAHFEQPEQLARTLLALQHQDHPADLIQIGLRERDRVTAWPILARHAIDGTAIREASGLSAIRVADGQHKLVAVLNDLREAGVHVESAMLREATLDDVFFALTGEDANKTEENNA